MALTPANLLWGFAGVTLGTMVGVLPGIGPALTVALLLPVTYGLDPTAALIMFAGIYYGAMYGGSTTSILLNTPGESATIVTALDGHQMARSGRGGAALATAAIGSFVAGTLGTLALSVTAPLMVRMALSFGSAEYFALMVLAFVMVTTVLGGSSLAGWMSLFLGLTLGSVGIDSLSGQARLTFGIPYLLDGIDPVDRGDRSVRGRRNAVGRSAGVPSPTKSFRFADRCWMTREEWSRSWKPWLRGAAIGFPMGALPAGGAELPTLMSYAVEKRLSRAPGRIRPRRHRGRRRTGSRQQRVGRWHARPLAHAWPADVGNGCRAACRVSAVRPAAGSTALRARAGARLGRDRESLRRQRDAARS